MSTTLTNGAHADFSDIGALGWNVGVAPALFVAAVYHLLLLPVGCTTYRANGLCLVLITAGVSAGLYAYRIFPTAIASGGPERFAASKFEMPERIRAVRSEFALRRALPCVTLMRCTRLTSPSRPKTPKH